MEKDVEYRKQLVARYRPDVERLLPYVPWLQAHVDAEVSQIYAGNGIEENSVAFPVYDASLLGFIKTVRKTRLLDRNYAYVYSKYRIKGAKEELRLMESATIREMNIIQGILSHYVIGGMTRGRMWSEAVNNRVFLTAVLKMKQILEYWDRPMV